MLPIKYIKGQIRHWIHSSKLLSLHLQLHLDTMLCDTVTLVLVELFTELDYYITEACIMTRSTTIINQHLYRYYNINSWVIILHICYDQELIGMSTKGRYHKSAQHRRINGIIHSLVMFLVFDLLCKI